MKPMKLFITALCVGMLCWTQSSAQEELNDTCLTTPQINFVIKQAFELRGVKKELANCDTHNEVLTGYSYELNKIIYAKDKQIDLYLLQNKVDKENSFEQVQAAKKSLKIQKCIVWFLGVVITGQSVYIKLNQK